MPGFEALFEREGQDFRRFYDAVRALAQQPLEERHAALRQLSTLGEATVAAGQPAPTPTARP
ncbi:hypothetical protein D3C72_2430350 [compost metagenome]